MLDQNNINEIAERYLKGELSNTEWLQVKSALAKDSQLQNSWNQTVDILKAFDTANKRSSFRNLVSQVAAEHKQTVSTKAVPIATKGKIVPFIKHVRTAAIAASLIFCVSLFGLYLMDKKDNKLDQKQFMLLRREMDNLKTSQTKIIDSLNKNNTQESASNSDVSLFGGTGFAIANNGYLATNYHVVKDAKSIYVQTKQGDKKAYIVARDANADIAIVKIEDNAFNFGKSGLPYKIEKHISGLGQRVFSIGFPKDEVVYNEGYISCESGFEGDVLSYQLEMIANPGQSGSPVLDSKGNIVALITGKQSNTSGTTFAVHSGALIDLVHTLSKAVGIKIPENNKLSQLDRTEQVRKIRDYVFSIKVN